jgi:hypothetical protein
MEHTMKQLLTLTAIALITTLSGCASITGTTTQNISVQTRSPDGKEIKEVQCDMINKRGTYFVTTPGTIVISRSNDDLHVTCRKDGLENGKASVVSDTKGSMFGNIVFGGGIGAVIDHSNGSAYEYPSFLQVVMGSDITIGKKKEDVAQNTNPMMGAASTPSNTALATKSTTTRLQELKKLKNDGLITEEVYEQRQTAILKESN